MLRHWIPFDNLNLDSLLLSNENMGVMPLLESEFNLRKNNDRKKFCKIFSSINKLELGYYILEIKFNSADLTKSR